MKVEVKVERDKKEAIKYIFVDTQLELKKTGAVLDATQENEAHLTAEGNALMKTVQGSLIDCMAIVSFTYRRSTYSA